MVREWWSNNRVLWPFVWTLDVKLRAQVGNERDKGLGRLHGGLVFQLVLATHQEIDPPIPITSLLHIDLILTKIENKIWHV